MFIANDTTASVSRVRRKHSTQSITSDGFYDDTSTTKQYKRKRHRHRIDTTAKRNPNKAPRIKINVRGRTYETYIDTLDRFPDTLLGNKELRRQYYNSSKEEIVLSRNSEVFEAVLFYYQSNGILARPTWVSETEFEKEIIFYQLQPKDSKKEKIKQKQDAMRQKKKLAAERRPRYQKIIWNLMEYPRSSTPAFTCAIISIITIILSVIVICLETVPSIVEAPNPQTRYTNRQILFVLETTVMVWFTAEYLLRILSAPLAFKFMFSFTGIIDLVVVVPYYINIVIGEEIRSFNLAVFRLVRMFRVFRIFKLTRYSTGLKVLGRTIMESLGQLVALFLCLFLSAILFASTLYFIEHEEVLDHVNGASSRRPSDVFQSIPGTFWYVIITMTSVGYGDVVPRTLIGRIVAAFCMVTGIIVLLCLPTPVFVTHFGRFYDDVIREEKEKEIDNNAAFKNGDDESGAGSSKDEIWRNEHDYDKNVIIPAWANDSVWKDKIGKGIKQKLTTGPSCDSGLNVYLSSSNLFLSRACSQEYLHTPQNPPK